jgi:hypothetical protein
VAVASKLKGVDSKFSAQLKNSRYRQNSQSRCKLRAYVRREEEFVSLLQQDAHSDVFLPSKPVGYFASDADCDDGKYCTSVEK